MEQRPSTKRIVGAFPLPKRPTDRPDREPHIGILADLDPAWGHHIAARIAALGTAAPDDSTT